MKLKNKLRVTGYSFLASGIAIGSLATFLYMKDEIDNNSIATAHLNIRSLEQRIKGVEGQQSKKSAEQIQFEKELQKISEIEKRLAALEGKKMERQIEAQTVTPKEPSAFKRFFKSFFKRKKK